MFRSWIFWRTLNFKMYFLGPCRAPVTCFINFNKEAQTLCKWSSKFGSASTAKEVTALFLLPFVNIRSVLQPGIKYINLLEVLHFISCWPAPSRSIQYNLARPYPGDVQMTSGMRILAQTQQKRAEETKPFLLPRTNGEVQLHWSFTTEQHQRLLQSHLPLLDISEVLALSFQLG